MSLGLCFVQHPIRRIDIREVHASKAAGQC